MSAAFAAPAAALDISADTRWTGEVKVDEDVRVAPGATLTIAPGARVIFSQALSTKTDPQFWSPETELAVEGRLVVEGEKGAEIRFEPAEESWGGVYVAPGGEAVVAHSQFVGAREALVGFGGKLALESVAIKAGEYGLVVGVGTAVEASDVLIEKCEKAVVDLTGGAASGLGITVVDAADAERFSWGFAMRKVRFSGDPHKQAETTREFLGEYTVEGEEVWQGTVIISDRVTVPPGAMLRLKPGTRVLFRKKDTNGDGLGEGELLVLGSIRALGTAEAPVVFDSAEASPKAGDWDKVSIISSEDNENLFEHCVFRHGMQSLHAHFSELTARNCLFEYNLRGLQFQESTSTVVEDSVFRFNKQALRFRDSTASVTDSEFADNGYAVHSFRADFKFTGNKVSGTLLGGMLAKESKLVMEKNAFANNRSAFRAKGEGSTLSMNNNNIENTVETALSLSDVQAELADNEFVKSGLDHIGIEVGDLKLRGNTFMAAKRHAIHLSGPAKVDAKKNFWPSDDAETHIHDSNDEKGLGTVIR